MRKPLYSVWITVCAIECGVATYIGTMKVSHVTIKVIVQIRWFACK